MPGAEGLLAWLLYGSGMRSLWGFPCGSKTWNVTATMWRFTPLRQSFATMICTHVLKKAAGGTTSPLDALSAA